MIFGAMALGGGPVREDWLRPLAADGQPWHASGSLAVGCGNPGPRVSADGRVAVALDGLLFGGEDPLEAWLRWGEGCLEHLDGEFSLAVLDLRLPGLLLAQSRLAHAPLHFVRAPGLFAFSSRMVPLLSLPGVEKDLDPEGFVRLTGNFAWREEDLQRTCFRGLESLGPACALRVGPEGERRWAYWRPDPGRVTPFASLGEVHEQVRERLRRSVRRRLGAARPVACMLSGGLDSTAVACLAAEGADLVAVSSVLAPGVGKDERPFIEIVRRHLGIEVEYVTPPAEPAPWEFSDAWFEQAESPALSPREYLYAALFGAAGRRGARVLLDGSFGESGPSARGPDGPVRRLRSRLAAAVRPYRAPRPWTPLAEGRFAALNPDFLRSTGVRPTDLKTRPRDTRFVDEAASWPKMARPSLLSSGGLEWQAPFRDLDLWEYCRGLPARLASGRGLLRGAMAGIMPEEIRGRTCKAPFSPDYTERFLGSLPRAREVVRSVSPGSRARAMLDLDWLDRAMAECQEDPALLTTERAFTCQGTLAALQFLDWFERLPVGAAIPEGVS